MVSKTNEELVLEYQQGNEYAGSDLYEQNYGLVREAIKRTSNINLDYADKLSAASFGFFNSLRSYKNDQGVDFAGYTLNIMINSITKEAKDRKNKIKTTSYNTLNNDYSSLEYIELHGEEDKYFEFTFANTGVTLYTLLADVDDKLGRCMVDVLTDKMKQVEACKVLNMSKQNFNQQLRRFKSKLREKLA